MSDYDIDDLDLRILDVLQQDATLSNQALSERVFTSAATTLRRVRALHDAGVIERHIVVLAPEKIGGTLNAICEITLSEQNAEAFDRFERLAIGEEAVTQCYRTSPVVDFTLILTVRNIERYNEIVQRLFTAANNVRNVRTRFATKRAKFSAAVPLGELKRVS
jgi:Lrp/AsnC family transcriptional regulator, leucine-responsive regulatory protein